MFHGGKVKEKGGVASPCFHHALVLGLDRLGHVKLRVAGEYPGFVPGFHLSLATRTDLGARDALVVVQPVHLLELAVGTALSAVVVIAYVVHLLSKWGPLRGLVVTGCGP